MPRRASLLLASLLALPALGCEAEHSLYDTRVRIVECAEPSECDDGVDCTSDECVQFVCRHAPLNARCVSGTWCHPTRDCQRGDPCSTTEPCESPDLCQAEARCVSGRCIARWGDADGDADPSIACGGGDCDDADPDLNAYRPEQCNGTDDDCDAHTDEAVDCGEGDCVRGECLCEPGATPCDGRCADVEADELNCGRCGNPCAPFAECIDGRCECPAPLVECSGECRTPRTDRGACGPCNVFCQDGARCEDDRCVCDAPLTACNGRCVDLSSDPSACGDCDTSCGSPRGTSCLTCIEGECVPDPGYATCGADRCVVLDSDSRHCGACGRTCPMNESCVGGECACAAPYTECGDACVYTLFDPLNCGECGFVCDGGAYCDADVCRPMYCGDTNAWLEWDREHCGGCDRPCADDASCIEGSCAPPACVRRRVSGEAVGLGADEIVWCSPSRNAAREGWLSAIVLQARAPLGEAILGEPAELALALRGDYSVCAHVVRALRWPDVDVTCFDADGALAERGGSTIAPRGLVTDVGRELVLGRGAPAGVICGGTEPGCRGFASRYTYDRLVMGPWDASVPASPSRVLAYAADGTIAGGFRGDLTQPWPMGEMAPFRARSGGGRDGFAFSPRWAEHDTATPAILLSGAGDQELVAVAYPPSGRQRWIGGWTRGDAITSGHALTGVGARDLVLLSVDPAFSVSRALLWGGPGDDAALALHGLADDGVIVLGRTEGELAIPGAPTVTSAGLFIARVSSAGNVLYQRALPGLRALDAAPWLPALEGEADALELPERGALAVSETHAWVAASFEGTITLGGDTHTSAGGHDIAVISIELESGAIRQVRTLGGPGDDRPTALVLSNDGTVWLAAIAADGFLVGDASLVADGTSDLALVHLR